MYLLDRVAAISLIVIAVILVVFTVFYLKGDVKFAQVNNVRNTYVMPSPVASPSASVVVSPTPVKTLLRTSTPEKTVVTVSPRK